MLRTIQVVNVRWFNATAWYGLKLASLLRKAGHESLVLALAGTESFAKAQDMGLDPVALPLNTVNPFCLAGLTVEAARLIRTFRPDVVNCHRGESFVLWGLLKPAGRFALVRTRGDQRLPRNNMPNRLLHRHTADALVATNSVMARHFVKGLGVPEERVHTVLGGVDTAAFRFDAQSRVAVRERYGFTDQHIVIGLLGRFDRVKGQKELLEAVARLVAEGRKDVRVLLLGFPTATSRAEVEGWIAAYNLTDKVTITGQVDDVTAHLCALDVGVVASLWSETIARAALEIMACGRPLLSTSVGVMPDLLPADALVPPGDVTALTNVLRRAIAEPAWRFTLQEGIGMRMRTLDDADFLSATLKVYEAALERRFSSKVN